MHGAAMPGRARARALQLAVVAALASRAAAQPASCAAHCGLSGSLGSASACYCDTECLDNNDCCSDLRDACPGVVAEHARLNQPPGCKDLSAKCGEWSNGGFCTGAYADYMADTCPLTCDYCDGPTEASSDEGPKVTLPTTTRKRTTVTTTTTTTAATTRGPATTSKPQPENMCTCTECCERLSVFNSNRGACSSEDVVSDPPLCKFYQTDLLLIVDDSDADNFEVHAPPTHRAHRARHNPGP